jgi:hypothetical protein
MTSKKYYHRSKYSSFKFNLDLSDEIGLHCGTLEQANSRPGKYLYELEVDITNMCELTNVLDQHWTGARFIRELYGSGIIDSAMQLQYMKEFRDEFPPLNDDHYKSEFCRNILKTLGYTGFIYPNQVEGEGHSICIIDESVIKVVTPLIEDLADWSAEFKLYESLWD